MLAPQRVTPALKRSAGAHRPANPTRRALPLYTPTPRRVDARGVSRAGGVASGIAVAIAIAHTPSPLYAVGTQLADDSAVMIGSDGVIYSLALDSAVATAGDTISGATFDYTVTGLEADPTIGLHRLLQWNIDTHRIRLRTRRSIRRPRSHRRRQLLSRPRARPRRGHGSPLHPRCHHRCVHRNRHHRPSGGGGGGGGGGVISSSQPSSR